MGIIKYELVETIKILGAVLELPAKQRCQFWPIYFKIGPNWPNWQCCVAGSSKRAHRILILSIAMGANYSFEVKNIELRVPAFFKHNNISVDTVPYKSMQLLTMKTHCLPTGPAEREGTFALPLPDCIHIRLKTFSII